MMNKWIIYFVTFVTYSLIHSVRTSWATLKLGLEKEPFDFSQQYLGVLDMIVLFTLAVSLNIFGHKVQKHSRRKLLFFTLSALIINLSCLYIGLMAGVTNKIFYLIFYGTIGIVSCLGWPICLYTMSQYFRGNNPIAISMWNSVSQFGDSIAFLLNIIIVLGLKIKSFNCLIVLVILLVLVMLMDCKLFKQYENDQTQELDKHPDEGDKHIDEGERKVNSCNVWAIEGVALPVLAFSIIKSINAIIIAWLVLYLDKIRMVKESKALAISWACGIVIGGFIGSIVNKHHSYNKFISFLFIAGILFFFLDQMHSRPHQFEVLILIVITAILVGSPYNQMGTAVPLKLGERQDIKSRPGAKAALISVMESCGQFMCGISVLIVPSIGVLKLHLMGSAYCFLSVILLTCEILRSHFFPRKHPQPGNHIQLNEIKEDKVESQQKQEPVYS